MPRKCFVQNCHYINKKNHKSTFLAPKDPVLFESWVQSIPAYHGPFTDKDVLCELHFKLDEVIRYDRFRVGGMQTDLLRERPKLAPNAVPSIFSPSTEPHRASPCNQFEFVTVDDVDGEPCEVTPEGATFDDVLGMTTSVNLPPLSGRCRDDDTVSFLRYSKASSDKGCICDVAVVFSDASTTPEVFVRGTRMNNYLPRSGRVTQPSDIERIIRLVDNRKLCEGSSKLLFGKLQFHVKCRGFVKKVESRCRHCEGMQSGYLGEKQLLKDRIGALKIMLKKKTRTIENLKSKVTDIKARKDAVE